jgi:hypothetical protein
MKKNRLFILEVQKPQYDAGKLSLKIGVNFFLLLMLLSCELNAQQLQNYFKNKSVAELTESFKSSVARNSHNQSDSVNPRNQIGFSKRATYDPAPVKTTFSYSGSQWAERKRQVFTWEAGTNLLLEEIIKYEENSIFINDEKIVNSYTQSKKLLGSLVYGWDGADWLYFGRIVNTYDSYENTTGIYHILEIPDTAPDTIYGRRFSFTYSSTGKVLTEIRQTAFSNGSWSSGVKTIYTYDLNDYLIQTLFENSAGENYLKIEAVVNTQGEPVELTNFYWDGGNWVINSKELSINWFDYENDKRSSYVTQTEENGLWTDKYKYIHTYNLNGELILSLSQQWDGTHWVNKNKVITTFNSYEDLTRVDIEIWNGTAWVIQDNRKNEYEYDAEGRKISEDNFAFNGVWEQTDKATFSYDIETKVSVRIKNEINIFPNPVRDVLTVSVVHSSDTVNLRLLSFMGDTVLETRIPAHSSVEFIEMNHLAPGVYFLQVISGDNISVNKIIKQ